MAYRELQPLIKKPPSFRGVIIATPMKCEEVQRIYF